jgi:hypothetical protein
LPVTWKYCRFSSSSGLEWSVVFCIQVGEEFYHMLLASNVSHSLSESICRCHTLSVNLTDSNVNFSSYHQF